jgi:hypothetical protein
MKREWLITAILVACGGAVTSVDGNKDVSTLGPTDKDQLCHDVANYVQTSISPTDFKKFVCGATSFSNDPTTCQAEFQTCMADPKRDVTFSSMIDCNGFAMTILKCQGVTVSQFSDCFKQYVDAIKTFASHMPICDPAAQLAAEKDLLNHISNQCLQTLSRCSGTTTMPMPPPMYDAGPPIYDAGSGGSDAGGG